MNLPLLSDPLKYPDDKVLARHLGKAFVSWNAFQALLKKSDPRLAGEWRYYNDGKSWLFKVTLRTTTLCWVAVRDKFFSTTFYLNTRAEDLVRESSLDNGRKQAFLHPAPKNKFRSIRVEVRKKSDLNEVEELIGIKLKVK
ncbi:MAG: DUF3788 family protein [Candidatus Aminicenantes bacterium]|nr:DUF3788 family protein [Candidatus Aminicenantes bacterium]